MTNSENGHEHDHEFDPDARPPYLTLFLLIGMVVIGVVLVYVFKVF